MSSMHGTLASNERQRWLESRLADNGRVTLAEAAAAFGVSEMTIRRDLVELEQLGIAKRVRGGAKALGPQSFHERRNAHTRAKGRIATKLAALVPSTGAVSFDASSTVMRLAGAVADARDLIVLTNGTDTFAALQGQPGVQPLLTGGRLDPTTGSLVGPFACRSATQLTCRRFFTSAAALDATLGACEATIDEAEVKRQLAAAADEVVLAVDSSKLATRAVAVALEWASIDVLVTELEPDHPRLAPFRGLTEIV